MVSASEIEFLVDHLLVDVFRREGKVDVDE
jgi:hypothetical protein